VDKQENPKQAIPTNLKSELLKYALASIIGILSFLSLHLASEVQALYLHASMPVLPNKPLFLIIGILTILFLTSLVSAFIFYRKTYVKPPSGGYTFQPDPGFYIHDKTKGHYCNPCLAKGYASRLSIHHEDGLKCRLCGEVYISQSSQTAAFKEYAKKYETL
jgi:hypothetical protein